MEAGGEEVGGEDFHAGELEEAGEHEADGALPGHEHGVAGQQGEAADGFEDGVNGFEHGSLLEGAGPGNFHDAGQDEGHDADVFGVAAAGGFKAGGDAGAFIGGALGKGVVAAEMAVETGNVMMQGHAVAGFEGQDAGPGFDDGAGGFMAEHTRRRDGAVMDFFDVRGADTANGDADEQFMAANGGDGDGFDAQVVGPAINDGPHGFGELKHAGILTTKNAGKAKNSDGGLGLGRRGLSRTFVRARSRKRRRR